MIIGIFFESHLGSGGSYTYSLNIILKLKKLFKKKNKFIIYTHYPENIKILKRFNINVRLIKFSLLDIILATVNWGVVVMENPSSGASGLGSASQGSNSLNSKFKLVKQMQAASQPSLKNLAPEANAVREMGAKFEGADKVGMTKINTADSTKIQTGPEVGKGGLLNEVF